MHSVRCNHSRDESYWIYDARGIELARVCERCEASVRERYRYDVQHDSQYWHDEEIDED